MSHPSEMIDELVKTHLKPALKELGFKCKTPTFFRKNGELVEIISLQKSQWNDAGEAQFTINLGVYWPNVQETLGRVCKTLPPKEYECTLRQRLGPLFDEGKDYWWRVNPISDIQAIGKDVVEKVRGFALPWLIRATSLDDAVKMAHTGEAVVLHTLKGDRAQASALITEAITRAKHAKGFFRSLAKKLELEIPAEF
jgi:hypothetical protein